MLWFKMPKNLEQLGIDPKFAPAVFEIMYYSNSKTGECSFVGASLRKKHFGGQRRDYERTISVLIASNILQKGEKKGQYFCNFNWCSEHKASKQRTKSEQTAYKKRATLTIDKKDKKRNISVEREKNLLAHYNDTFGRKLKESESNLKFYTTALKYLKPEQIELSHRIIKSKLDNGSWSSEYIAPANLFNSKTIHKRVSEVEEQEFSDQEYQSAVDYLSEVARQSEEKLKNNTELQEKYRSLGIEIC